MACGQILRLLALKVCLSEIREMGASGDDEPAAQRSNPASEPQYTAYMYVDLDTDTPNGSSIVHAAVSRGPSSGLKAAVL